MSKTENEKAAEDLATEKEKYGFGPRKAEDVDHDDSEEDMGDLDEDTDSDEEEEETDEEDVDDEDEDDESEEDSEDSDDDSDEDEEEEEDEEDDDEEDSEKDPSRKSKRDPKKVFKKYNKLRSKVRALKKQVATVLKENEALQKSLPDDFQDRVTELTKEIGVEDPAGLEKIIKFIKEFAVDKNVKKLEDKIAVLEKQVTDSKVTSVVDEFPKEWEAFENDFFKKEFPDATPEQIKSVKTEMERLSKTRNIGGKAYIDESTGQEVLDPYPLDYIFYKNRDKFSEIVGGKKRKGMETSRTNRHENSNKDDEIPHLNKNSTATDIRKLDKKYSKMESGAYEGMRSPTDNTI